MAVILVGVRFGTFVAADTDAYGYVSQAELIAQGTLRLDQTFARSMPWPNPEWTFLPTSYTLAPDRRFAVPVYASGLPLLMGLAQRITGQREAVYYVVPLLGALAVWMTYRLGRSLDTPATGALASLLLATSPIFLNQVMQPVSDLPAAAWLTACLALAVRGTAAAALGAGAAASMAILTRPNLVPLGIVIGAFLIWSVVRASGEARRGTVRRVLLFAAASAPGCLAVAAINHHLHGSPLQSGYGSVERLFGWENVLPNLDRYPRWLAVSQTPFIYLGLLAPFTARVAQRPRVWLLLACSLTLFGMTVFFLPFGREDWGYLRFLLPAYPALLILSIMVATRLMAPLAPRRAIFRTVAAAGVIALCLWQVAHAERRGAFVTHVAERRYLQVGRYIAVALPDNAVFISGLHSSSPLAS
ncbi:MAG TPA: glycosyltransferase family 39 protein [Vicinamibacterales bacterium]|nr:glycosyltransferase family 39 protein [Vicinamibacterales bacterium]